MSVDAGCGESVVKAQKHLATLAAVARLRWGGAQRRRLLLRLDREQDLLPRLAVLQKTRFNFDRSNALQTSLQAQ